jgi:hypothetical protein
MKCSIDRRQSRDEEIGASLKQASIAFYRFLIDSFGEYLFGRIFFGPVSAAGM